MGTEVVRLERWGFGRSGSLVRGVVRGLVVFEGVSVCFGVLRSCGCVGCCFSFV